MSNLIYLKPRLSEKSVTNSQSGVYVFQVPGDANKHSVARAVESQFNVTVVTVNILNVKGKAKRTITKKGRRAANGKQADIKKAYVTLAEGQKLPLFEADEEAEAKQAELQKQLDKVAAKQSEKEAKEEAKASKKAKKEESK